MNFLAHFHLSNNQPELAIGNFLGDFTRFQEIEHLSNDIVKGWQLHRYIDEYTDSHNIVHRSKELARPVVRKYAPVLIDIFYDYFLANNWHSFSENSLRTDTLNYYQWMEKSVDILPNQAKRFYLYALRYDIFYAYKSYKGIEKVLQGMSNRASFQSNFSNGVLHLKKHRKEYENDFLTFYPELEKAASTFLREMSY